VPLVLPTFDQITTSFVSASSTPTLLAFIGIAIVLAKAIAQCQQQQGTITP